MFFVGRCPELNVSLRYFSFSTGSVIDLKMMSEKEVLRHLGSGKTLISANMLAVWRNILSA
jgi:hypothetical protein